MEVLMKSMAPMAKSGAQGLQIAIFIYGNNFSHQPGIPLRYWKGSTNIDKL